VIEIHFGIKHWLCLSHTRALATCFVGLYGPAEFQLHFTMQITGF